MGRNFYDVVLYKKARERAHAFYNNIKSISCPVFGGEGVYFTSVGFNHLIRKGKIQRAKSEQLRRFVLLFLVKNIIESKRDISELHYRLEGPVEFWTFNKNINGDKIKVVLFQKSKTGRKYFLSVMGNQRIVDLIQAQKIPT